MSFLKKIRDGKDVDVEDENPSNKSQESLEKLYEKLFMKMGRDFVHIEDFQRIIIEILENIDPALIEEIDFYSQEHCVERAYEYKNFLEEGMDGSKVYRDLIVLEEDWCQATI